MAALLVVGAGLEESDSAALIADVVQKAIELLDGLDVPVERPCRAEADSSAGSPRSS
jgi:hypothetical protein